MGGFYGITSNRDCVLDVFFGTDYHSHLGTKRGGMAAWDESIGMQREIHNIENSPFRTKFENITAQMKGKVAIGCISDTDPQPLLIRSLHGIYAITIIGKINNLDELIDKTLDLRGGHFDAMTSGRINQTELVAALISQQENIVDGIKYAQAVIEGTCNILIMMEGGKLIAARDRLGRLPIEIGHGKHCKGVASESFSLFKLGLEEITELGPGEIVEITPDEVKQLVAPGEEMKICSFLWSYYGYPTTSYEGVNVEMMRYENGRIMARNDIENGFDLDSVDYIGGVPDSGTPHAIGYSNASQKAFTRAFIKYTPTWARSFMPSNQSERNKVAKMKQIPVLELIKGKNLLFVDDSIVRGTQLRETVEFLYENGAKEVHMRSACPPLMYGCKYINFSSSKSEMDLITRRTIVELEGEEGLNHIDEYSDGSTERGKAMRKAICDKFHFDSLEFQSLEGIKEAIGIDPCKLCTYCWDGKE
ncbi:MAG: amidophosphoribosyltransferase [Firmicutes bacterium]|nr:amidophosphoribosyltransferase [Bacillota bacterium]